MVDEVPSGKPRNIFQKIAAWVTSVHDWAAARFSDPLLVREILADLGQEAKAGPSGHDFNAKPAVDKIDAFIAKGVEGADKQALNETIEQIRAVIEDVVQPFIEAVEDPDVAAPHVFAFITRLWINDALRLRAPGLYALLQTIGLLIDDEEVIPQIDLSWFVRLTEMTDDDIDTLLAQASFVAGALVVALEQKTSGSGSGLRIEALYGWDEEDDDDDAAAEIARRTLTVVLPTVVEGVEIDRALTFVTVPQKDGGPGIFIASSDAVSLEAEHDGLKYEVELSKIMQVGAFLPLTRSAAALTPSAALEWPRLSLSVETTREPALVVGLGDGTRLEIGRARFAADVTPEAGNERVAVRLAMGESKLVIEAAEGDAFLAQALGGPVEVPFDLALIADTRHGLRLEGGTATRTRLPVSRTIGGVVTLQSVELELDLEAGAVDVLSGFSLKLGPFKASVHGVGLRFAPGAVMRAGGPFDPGALVQFTPPRGIGLSLEAGPIKGGGALEIDPRGAYAGALELELARWSIKAIGTLSTRRPDGRDGWSLLLFVFAQFEVPFGPFVWTGAGGMIGLHHGVDLDALQAAMRTRALDDVLFPADPVADAPRILSRYRQFFPYEEGTLVLGPVLEFRYNKPALATARIGFIVEIGDALSAGPARLSSISLIGQLLAELPARELGKPTLLKLLVDVVGFYDFEAERLLIRARLRDSFVGVSTGMRVDLAGELVLAMSFGAQPSFVLAAGGFHPAFRDLPPGVPAEIDRLGASLAVGKLDLQTRLYFAITSNSVQTGFRIDASAKLGPASLKGWLSFDALVHLTPRFRFLVDLMAGVSIKAFGQTLTASIELSLEGPGRWRARGVLRFSILGLDHEVGFDEAWGENPAVEAGTVDGGAVLIAALSAPECIEPVPPPAGEALVTPAKVDGGAMHPAGRLVVRQRAVPLDVTIDRIGLERLEGGARRFAVDEVRIDGEAASVTPVTDHFARGHFMALTDREKLEGRAFERFTSGVAVGAEGWRVPSVASTVVVEHERKILEPAARFEPWKIGGMTVSGPRLPFPVVAAASPIGAVGRSPGSLRRALVVGGPGAALVAPPPLAVTPADTLRAHAAQAAPGHFSATALAQTAPAGSMVIERWEVVA